jgi:hypothetical protein
MDRDARSIAATSGQVNYNLQAEIPAARRARALNDLVCIAYEDRPLDPEVVDDIAIHEPLRSWLIRTGGHD